jgi:adenylate cyclase
VTSRPGPGQADEEFWREFLTRGDPVELAKRRLYKHLPRDPRCKMCAAPFEGFGASVMRLVGKRRSQMNPQMCTTCFDFLRQHHGGAEIEATLLFADVRGSTALAETMTPTRFREVMGRFYTTATEVVFAGDGFVDKFVGDEIVAMFMPLLAGDEHAARGVETAMALLRATGHEDPAGPWVPVGAGVHTGTTWVGAVGDAQHTEVTVLGDSVNTTARLAAAAGAGEILVTAAAAAAAGIDDTGLERTRLELKGKQETTDVLRLRIRPS